MDKTERLNESIQIARRIADSLESCVAIYLCDGHVKQIAMHLREYGEAQRLQGYREGVSNGFEQPEEVLKQADAEGYRRGVEIVMKHGIPLVPEDMDIEDPKRAWINGYEDCIMDLRNLLQRGQEDEK